MKEQLISFETAKLAKEKGFYILTEYSYFIHPDGRVIDGTPYYEFPAEIEKYKSFKRYMAPTQSLLQKWLREKKGWHIIIEIEKASLRFFGQIWNSKSKLRVDLHGKGYVLDKTYEEALEEGLKEALKLIK